MGKRMWRQGDIFIMEAERVPKNAKAMPRVVLAEGEITGHSHRLAESGMGRLYETERGGDMFLDITADRASIIHEEHETVELDRGVYRVWRQREYSPEAVRQVMD
jgi:hypothetical protein